MIKRNHCYLFLTALGLLISNVQVSTIQAKTIQSSSIQANKQQSAEQIMEHASSLFTSKGGVSILFKMVTQDDKSLVVATNQGLLQMDSLKYMLKTDVSQSWYDGATQWSYLTDTEEVNILSPSNAELLESNPYLFIFSYKDLFNARLLSDFVFTGSSKTNSSLNFIEFVPKSKDYPYQKIVLGIDKFSYEINQMDIFMTDGHVMNLKVQQFKTGIQYTKKTFQFVKGLLPDAEIIDLR